MKAKRILPRLAVGSLVLITQMVSADVLNNWTTNQLSTNRFGLFSVVYGNERYVAAGSYSDYGVIVSSQDGLHWNLEADGGPPNPTGAPVWGLKVNFSNGRFIATAALGLTLVSTNGINWALSGAEVENWVMTDLRGATYGGGRYVAVGEFFNNFGFRSVSNIISSSDGITWTVCRSHPQEALANVDVTFGSGMYVAIGNNDGFIYTSPNSTTWTRRAIAGGATISFCREIFIIPYTAGTNLISENGVDWGAVATGIPMQMDKAVFANGLFMARVGNGYPGLKPYLATSRDGTNWVQHQYILPGRELATDGARLVTVGNISTNIIYHNGFVYTSGTMVDVRMTNTSPSQIVLSGLIGRSYQIQAKNDLAETNAWQTLTTLQLPSTPYLFTDPSAANSPQRFYRGVLLP